MAFLKDGWDVNSLSTENLSHNIHCIFACTKNDKENFEKVFFFFFFFFFFFKKKKKRRAFWYVITSPILQQPMGNLPI